MNIEKILDDLTDEYFTPYSDEAFPWEKLIQTVKEYAEWYARQCLQIAADNATGRFETDTQGCEYIEINQESILNITLPPHE